MESSKKHKGESEMSKKGLAGRFYKLSSCGELLAETILFIIEMNLMDEFEHWIKTRKAKK